MQDSRPRWRQVIKSTEPYNAIVERAGMRGESQISATDVAAHWHEHFRDEAGDSDKTLNDQAVCFFQLVAGAQLGNLVIGRLGSPTRIEFDLEAIRGFVEETTSEPTATDNVHPRSVPLADVKGPPSSMPDSIRSEYRRVFISHGANRQIVGQLKELVQFGKFEPVVSVENETASKPVPDKVFG